MSTGQDPGREATGKNAALGRWKDRLQILQSAFTIAAIIVGGLWTYNLFIKERVGVPRFNIEHKVVSRHVNDKYVWLHVNVIVMNVGKRKIFLDSGYVRVQQIVPLPESVKAILTEKQDPVHKTAKIVLWDQLCQKRKSLKFELEPNEAEPIAFEFILPSDISTVKIHSFFEDKEQSSNGLPLGWPTTTIYDIPATNAGGDRNEIEVANSVAGSIPAIDSVCDSDQ